MIDRIHELERGYGPQAEEIKEMALQYAAAARERLAQGGDSIKEFTVKQPAKALGLALGMGVFLGWLIKRR